MNLEDAPEFLFLLLQAFLFVLSHHHEPEWCRVVWQDEVGVVIGDSGYRFMTYTEADRLRQRSQLTKRQGVTTDIQCVGDGEVA